MTQQEIQGHSSVVLRRPCTLFLGDWEECDINKMRPFVGDVHCYNNLHNAMKNFSSSDVDLIVARNAFALPQDAAQGFLILANYKGPSHPFIWRKDWLSRAFFIFFGGGDLTPLSPEKNCSSLLEPIPNLRIELFTTKEAGELQDLTRLAIKSCLDGRKFHSWRYQGTSTWPDSLVVDEWLVSNPDGVSLAFHRFDKDLKLGTLALQEPLCQDVSYQRWLAAALRLWHEKAPERFPNVVTWRDESAWMTTQELILRRELERLDKERTEALKDFHQREARLNGQLEQARIEAEQKEKRLLTTQGDELVDAVKDALERLGFLIEIPPEEETNHKREDLLATCSELPDWEASVEVKGFATTGAKLAVATKLDRRVAGRGSTKGVLVVNGEFGKEPNLRGPLFGKNQEVLEAVRESDVLVIDTRDLFQALFDEEKKTALIDAIKGKVGTYPSDTVDHNP